VLVHPDKHSRAVKCEEMHTRRKAAHNNTRTLTAAMVCDPPKKTTTGYTLQQ
jgi:hypothetical protein